MGTPPANFNFTVKFFFLPNCGTSYERTSITQNKCLKVRNVTESVETNRGESGLPQHRQPAGLSRLWEINCMQET
ncbi:hypothetical protein FF021_13320 [Leptospira noguchii]|nr:hypothetical protein FF021_13320 [Leptospira noguchii]